MNRWGKAFQTGDGSGVLTTTPYGPGLFNGNPVAGSSVRAVLPPLPLRAGQVDHRHRHEVRQQLHLRGRVHRARLQVRVRAVGPVLAARRPVDVGRRPERRAPGRGRPEPRSGQEPHHDAGRDRALAGSRRHVPRQGPRPDRSGHAGRQRRRQQRPGRGRPHPFGAVPYDFGQDTMPFQQIFERLRHPERHEYLFERDGMSAR